MDGTSRIAGLIKSTFNAADIGLYRVWGLGCASLRALRTRIGERRHVQCQQDKVSVDQEMCQQRPPTEESLPNASGAAVQPSTTCARLSHVVCFVCFPMISCPGKRCSVPSSSSYCNFTPCFTCNPSTAKTGCKGQYICNSVTLLFFISLVILFYWNFHDDYLAKVLNYLEEMDDRLAIVMFIILFTIASLPLVWGYVVLNLAAGYRYGIFAGVIIVMASVTVGLTVTHRMSQKLCAGCIMNALQKRMDAVQMESILKVLNSPAGLRVVALTRLTPIPFGLQNGIFSMSSMKTSHYVTASNIGLFPTQILNCYIGSTLHSAEDIISRGGTIGGYILLFFQMSVGLALMTFVIRRARRELSAVLDGPYTGSERMDIQSQDSSMYPPPEVHVSQPVSVETV